MEEKGPIASSPDSSRGAAIAADADSKRASAAVGYCIRYLRLLLAHSTTLLNLLLEEPLLALKPEDAPVVVLFNSFVGQCLPTALVVMFAVIGKDAFQDLGASVFP